MRDHSCVYPNCILLARGTCPNCHNWLCGVHLDNHDCKKLEAWLTSGPSLNAFRDIKPGDVTPTGKDWREDLR
jgi:hypothetical protein